MRFAVRHEINKFKQLYKRAIRRVTCYSTLRCARTVVDCDVVASPTVYWAEVLK
jgi:hypothetical protein